jgi:glycosyltransferase involved in cell wall biosynthesis
MAKVSIIIPSRDESFLNNTIKDLIKNATGEIEILAVLDGETSHPLPKENSIVKLIKFSEPMGMRHGINIGAEIATGKYIMKLDSHCKMSKGYDKILQEDCEDDFVIVTRRNELSPEWEVTDTTPVDYFYMSSPWTSPNGYFRMSRWITRDRQRSEFLVDETLTFSGSNWFMSKDHFFKRIGTLDEDRFGQWSGEPEEIACKTWLGGGKVLVNKKVIHAHLRKEKIGRPYHISWGLALKGLQEGTRYWSNDEWPHRIHNFDWLIDKFWPLPTKEQHCNGERYFWEDDWKERYYVKH